MYCIEIMKNGSQNIKTKRLLLIMIDIMNIKNIVNY